MHTACCSFGRRWLRRSALERGDGDIAARIGGANRSASKRDNRSPFHVLTIVGACIFNVALGSSWPAVAASEACRSDAVPASLQTPGLAPAGVVTMGEWVIVLDDIGSERAILACKVNQTGQFQLSKQWPLPTSFSIQDVSVQGVRIVLTSSDGEKFERVVRASDNETESPQTPSLADADGYRFTAQKLDDGAVRLKIPLALTNAEAPSAAIDYPLRPVLAGSQIFTRRVLSIDPKAATAAIYWEEEGQGTRAFIAKVDRNGEILAGAEVPLQALDTVPERFVGMLNDGRAYYLRVAGTVSEPMLLPLNPDFAKLIAPAGALQKELQERSKKESAPVPEKRSGETPASPTDATNVYEGPEFQDKVRQQIGESHPPTEVAPPQVSRASAVSCAKEFSTYRWTLTAGSHSKPGVENKCDPQAKFWLRPFYLNGQAGREITGVPYCWGCSDSLQKFTSRVAAGSHLAGHSCTCREGHYCLRSDATGVDCSGFISQCWKSGYYQTSRMHEIADIIDKRNLKPGDALNKSGSHIRLFIEIVSTPTGDRYRMIEAANGEGDIGRVIDKNYTASQLSTYKAIRYRKIVD